MKLLALTLLVAAAGLIGGCQDTPGYSASERYSIVGRNWAYEQQQINDDVDHALMIRPSGYLTIWNVQHND